MSPEDFTADQQRAEAATARLNAGEQIPEVEAAWIDHMWDIRGRIPPDKKNHTAIGLGAIAGGDPAQIDPEHRVALMARYLLLDAVVELRVLDDYMDDESKRKEVFAAAASMKCDKNDLGEALAQKTIRESPPDVAEKVKQELRAAGCDPDHPRIGDRFVKWMRDRRR